MKRDFVDLFWDVHDWSRETFGTAAERGPIGPLKHLKKEADEAIADPTNLLEYADILILLMDAVGRAGFYSSELLGAVEMKMEINRQRTYPKPTGDEISEHVKENTDA